MQFATKVADEAKAEAQKRKLSSENGWILGGDEEEDENDEDKTKVWDKKKVDLPQTRLYHNIHYMYLRNSNKNETWHIDFDCNYIPQFWINALGRTNIWL